MLLVRVSKILKSITMVVLYEDLSINPWTIEGRKSVERIANPTPEELVLIQVGIIKSPGKGVLVMMQTPGNAMTAPRNVR